MRASKSRGFVVPLTALTPGRRVTAVLNTQTVISAVFPSAVVAETVNSPVTFVASVKIERVLAS